MSERDRPPRAPVGTAHATAELACGRDPDALLAQVADGRPEPDDAHQRSCPHCRAALAEIDRLWGPVRAVARYRPLAPPGVLDTALVRVRGLGADPGLGRIEDGRGHTSISARAVVTLARHLAARQPGVRAALARLGAGAVVEVVIAADYGENLPALAERVRGAVVAAVRETTGLELAPVSVVVDDVFPRR